MRVVCHTHSDYFDVLEIFLFRYDRFCSLPLTILTNKIVEGRDCFVYDDSMTYKERWAAFLSNCVEDVCVLHEDFILYFYTNIPPLPNGYDCVRLQYNGNLEYKNDNGQLYEIVGNNDRFSITPSIWKSKSLKEFLEKSSSNSIWDLELLEQQNTISMKIGFFYAGEPKVGSLHYRSNFFPCILSAISKGRWNYFEYKEELDCVFKEYDIDKNIRGVL